jgi:hypothetical protein
VYQASSNPVPGKAAIDEHDPTIVPRQSLATEGHVLDGQA